MALQEITIERSRRSSGSSAQEEKGMKCLKTLGAGVMALGVLFFCQSASYGAEVTFSGTVMGQFCSPTCTAGGYSNNTSFQNLTYYGSTFGGTTSAGVLDWGGSPVAGLNNDNFGAFNLVRPGTGTNIYTGQAFQLLVTFTLPSDINSGNNPTTFSTTLLGAIDSNGNGGLFITWAPNTMAFTMASGGGFTLAVQNVSPTEGALTSIDAHVATTGVPEPSAFALLGSGLLGVAFLLKRRTRRS